MLDKKLIRNFIITSHVDHGKSTLADRFLEITGTIDPKKMRPCYLDMDDLEREKGITIKMRPVRMDYTLDVPIDNVDRGSSISRSEIGTQPYILNLIDTPGHVDFSYEVSRALAAVEGAILLVDATKGIQAQTISNLDLAKSQNLTIIPVINKIDSPQAKTEEVKIELSDLLNISPDEILSVSAKEGTNAKELLETAIKKVPCPEQGEVKNDLRALVFDSQFDAHKGVVAFVRIVDGEIKKGEKIYLLSAKAEGEAKEIGVFKPDFSPQESLSAGEIGYIATGIKEPGKVRVGDTITSLRIKLQGLKLPESLPGYKEPKPMVFASVYPASADDYDLLKESLLKLKLNDASLSFEPESKGSIGRGFLCGFLGMLHAEIISERLRREFGLSLIISSPSVLFKIFTRSGEEIFIRSASDFPDPSKIEKMEEPWVKLEVMAPSAYLGRALEVMETLEGKYLETKYLGQNRLFLVYEVPLRNIITNFYEQLKNVTQGYGSLSYEFLEYRPAQLVKLDILIAGQREEAFSRIVPEKHAFREGKRMVEKLKNILPGQQFSLAIQAAVGSQIMARETIRAKGRDVTAPLYGGDITRKRKLLEKQKEGKKELKAKANVRIPQEVFLEMLKG